MDHPDRFVMAVIGAILAILVVFLVIGWLYGDNSTDPNGGDTGSRVIAPQVTPAA